MSVLTFKSDEYKSFPEILKNYASYTATVKGNSEKTVCEYLLDIRTFFRFIYIKNKNQDFEKDEFEKISISSLTLDDIKEIRTQHIVDFLMFAGYERENSTTTRMRKLSALKSLFNYLHTKRHYIDNNPTVGIDAPKKASTLPKFMNTEEAMRLITAVENDKESKTRRRDYTIIVLFLNTGMRLSELVGLNLESFDSELSFVTVRGKGNKERIIYLNSGTKNVIKSYLRERLDPKHIRTSDNAMFLSSRQQRISTKTVQWIIYRYLDLAGLGSRGLSVHKLRHTAATLMYQSGKVDVRVLKDILGHEQLNTTQIYTHVVGENIRDAVQSNPLSDLLIKINKKTEQK